jgi:hypothetical protein
MHDRVKDGEKSHKALSDMLSAPAPPTARVAFDLLPVVRQPMKNLKLERLEAFKARFDAPGAKRSRVSWTEEEEEALKEGVEQYGEGAWAAMLQDCEIGRSLAQRTNIDLKDKWRVLNGRKRAKVSLQ